MEKPNADGDLCAVQHNLSNIKKCAFIERWYVRALCARKNIDETEGTMMMEFVQSLVHPVSMAINLLHLRHRFMCIYICVDVEPDTTYPSFIRPIKYLL